MPELPDIVVYIEHLERTLRDQPLERARIQSPFLVRSVSPRPSEAEGRRVVEFRRIGKRIVMGFEGDLFYVFHLMIAGRLRWRKAGTTVPRKRGLAAFDFPNGTLLLTEASSKKRASLHVVEGEAGLETHDPGGLEVLDAGAAAFRERLTAETHTLKRTLTDPRVFSGIGNAYSDEILHRAGLSPLTWTSRLSEADVDRLHAATIAILTEWTARLRERTGDAFPDKVTAFHPDMAVHGRFGQPCPVCGSTVQRIAYASNETNYCPTCQTEGKLLADRGLSRLLKKDWPRTLEELESLKAKRSDR